MGLFDFGKKSITFAPPKAPIVMSPEPPKQIDDSFLSASQSLIADEKPAAAPMSPPSPDPLFQPAQNTFEIPDFAEEDLDFELGLDEFMPDKKAAPVAKPEPQITVPDDDLPAFEVSPTLNLERELADMQPNKKKKQEPALKIEKIDTKKVFEDETLNKADVYIEKASYEILLIEEDKISAAVKDSHARATNILQFFRQEDEVYDSMAKSLIDVQRKLATLDMRIFEKGD